MACVVEGECRLSLHANQLALVSAIEYFLLPLDGMLFHRGVTPSTIFAGALGGERRYGDKTPCPRDRNQCPRLGFEPRQVDPESNICILVLDREVLNYIFVSTKKTWNDTITLVQ